MSARRRDTVPLHGDSKQVSEDLASGGLPAPGLEPTPKMQLEVAIYIENMSAELRLMARGVGLDGLAYFLEMVRIEASLQIERRAESN